MNGRKVMSYYLFDHTPKIIERINNSAETFLFLDYDGTLVPFKDRPQDVVTPNEIKNVLYLLQKHLKFKVFIISGRILNEIKQLINIDGLSFAALHGLQIELSNGEKFFWEQAENIRPILKEIKSKTLKEFKHEKGIKIEDKKYTLAFHYRLLPNEKIKRNIEKFENIVNIIDTKKTLDLIYGEKVVEIRPKGWDKGKAVVEILNNVAKSDNYLPIYIGDDTTDEDAFREIEKQGITIFIANKTNKPTAAKYWLKDTNDVLMFLKSLTNIKKEI